MVFTVRRFCNARYFKAFLSICPSVPLSVKRMDCDKTKETYVHVIIHPSFLTRMVGGGRLLPEILGQTDPVGAKKPIFNRYSVVAPQP